MCRPRARCNRSLAKGLLPIQCCRSLMLHHSSSSSLLSDSVQI